jgi:hypothetical protein
MKYVGENKNPFQYRMNDHCCDYDAPFNAHYMRFSTPFNAHYARFSTPFNAHYMRFSTPFNAHYMRFSVLPYFFLSLFHKSQIRHNIIFQ